MIAIYVGLVLSLAAVVFGVIVLIRNDRVLIYRQHLIGQIGEAISADLRDGQLDYEWRWEAFHVVTYHSMVYRFWKPLDSFYPDLDFCEPRHGERI